MSGMKNSIYIFTGGIILLITLLVGFIIFGFFSKPETPAQIPGMGSPFDTGPIVNVSTSGQTPGSSTTVPAIERTVQLTTVGGSVLVRDFMKDTGVWTSADQSYVVIAGAPSATSTSALPYEIIYFPSDKTFMVSLLKEPLGEVRIEAVKVLLDKLGVTGAELCMFVAQVTVPRGVNDFYVGANLGFPGCPGATKLPGDPVF